MAIFFPTTAALKKAKDIVLRSEQKPAQDPFADLRPDAPEVTEAQARQFQKENFYATTSVMVMLAENHRQLVKISRGVWVLIFLVLAVASERQYF